MKRKALAAAVGTGALLVGLAVPAMAQPGGLSQAAVSEECGQATLTLTNDTTGTYSWEYGAGANDGSAPNEHLGFASVPAGETVTVPVQLEEDSFGGSAFVSYGTFSGPEQDLFLAHDAIAVDTDCGDTPPVTDECKFEMLPAPIRDALCGPDGNGDDENGEHENGEHEKHDDNGADDRDDKKHD